MVEVKMAEEDGIDAGGVDAGRLQFLQKAAFSAAGAHCLDGSVGGWWPRRKRVPVSTVRIVWPWERMRRPSLEGVGQQVLATETGGQRSRLGNPRLGWNSSGKTSLRAAERLYRRSGKGFPARAHKTNRASGMGLSS